MCNADFVGDEAGAQQAQHAYLYVAGTLGRIHFNNGVGGWLQLRL